MNMEVVKEILKVIGIIVLIYLFKAVHKIIYIAYFGPLSKLPGPKLFFLSRLFISFQQFTGKRWEFIQFKIIPKYGRIVRLGPELVLIADKDLIKDRRTLSPAFSIKYMSSLEPLMETCIKDLIIKVDELINNDNYDNKEKFDDDSNDDRSNANTAATFNILRLVQSCAIDIIGETSFGGKFDGIKTVNHPLPGKVWLELRRRILRSMLPLLKPFFRMDPYLKEASNKSKDIDDGYYDGENGALLKHEQLKGLPYLNAVIHETMRLWPVVLDGGIGRAPTEDIIVKGYLIPKDTNLMINYYTLHHDPEYWGADVENFIPERWFDIDKLPKDSFYPFSAGARNCIGQNFAMMEMRLIIGSLIYKYDIENLPNQNIDIVHYFTPTLRDQCYQLKFRKQSVQHKNGVDAEALFEKFKTFTTDTPCEPDNVACIDGNFAKCHETLDNDGNVVNTWAISQCAEGTNCYPLPLVFSRGVSLVCDTREDFDRRIKEALAS
ncbi:9639_t:CDS:10 [Entrophospora sp. SA101]|nr:9639_t:CDS:10 [Entrophospora sp. SA101]